MPHPPTARLAALVAAMVVSLPARSQVNVVTYHNDNARTGQSLNETLLTPSNVGSTTFGLLFNLPVDGYVYAQPLYLSKLVLPGKGTHNVVFIATEHDSVYAFDADSIAGANASPLWQVSLVPPGGTSVPSGDTNTTDLVPEVGITGTPVIDPKSGTLYAVAKTKEAGQYVQRLHALDVKTGREKFGGPVRIAAWSRGTGDGSVDGIVSFDALHQQNRAALLLANGVVYLAFGSHGDVTPYHGWVIAYDAHSLRRVATFNTTPNGSTDPSGYPLGGGAIWQGGAGLAIDSSGNLFFETGNGTFDIDSGGLDYGDSFVKLKSSHGLAAVDYFTPYDQAYLNDNDVDLGSGGLVLLPDSAGSAAHPHLLVGCGKEGTIYLIDRDNLGHYDSTSDHVVQSVPYAVGGVWGMPAYYNSAIYYGGVYDAIKRFTIASGSLTVTPASESSALFGYPGPTPTISANGNKNGIVWAIDSSDYWESGPAILHALDAADVSSELYSSNQVAADQAGPAVKFTVPTVANGKVYLGAEYVVSVYGSLSR